MTTRTDSGGGSSRPNASIELGAADNFWAMGETGPCGRCSEIHYYRGDHVPCPEPACRGLECSCDRFIEVWNNVFMEFDRQADGNARAAAGPVDRHRHGARAHRRVDAGQAVELRHRPVHPPARTRLARMVGRRHRGTMDPADVSMRVIADHARAATFLIADGVVPSNEWRGYVLRKIMRRAMRHGHKLGITDPFLHKLVDVLVDQMGDAYPELRSVARLRDARRPHRRRTIRRRAERRAAPARRPARLGPRHPASCPATRHSGCTIRTACRWTSSKISPAQRNLTVDRAGIRPGARGAAWTRTGQERVWRGGRRPRASPSATRHGGPLEQAGDQFEGYTSVPTADVPVVARARRTAVTKRPRWRRTGRLRWRWRARPSTSSPAARSRTPGASASPTAPSRRSVTGMARGPPGWPRLHRVHVERARSGAATSSPPRSTRRARDATRRNHTATHLLHARAPTGAGLARQAGGSLVSPDRLRFDFVHFAPVDADEIEEIERLVNEQVYPQHAGRDRDRVHAGCHRAGAMALFGEKYGDAVRVVSWPGSARNCAAARTAGPPATSVPSSSSRKAASRPACDASRRFTGGGGRAVLQERRHALDDRARPAECRRQPRPRTPSSACRPNRSA